MLRCLVLLFILALSAPAGAQTAPPAPNPSEAAAAPVYTLNFFETVAGSHGRTAKLLRAYAKQTEQAGGNLAVLPLHEIARPARFALVEVWRDKAAADAHAGALGALRGALRPVLTAPFDARVNSGLDIAGEPVGPEEEASRAVYVLTHVDVVPAGKDQAIDMLRQLAAVSRKEQGNLLFDVLQQEGRTNHLPLFEEWKDLPAQNAHAEAAATRTFRTKLVTLQGALYDERLYRAIR